MKLTWWAVIVAIGLYSCNDSKPEIAQVKDESLAIEVMRMKKSEDPTVLDYRVRIIPQQDIAANKEKLREMMWYDTDSCFYLLDKGKVIYPELQEPVANGRNDYEYLLLFGKEDNIDIKDIKLVYHDKHINKRTYNLDFNEK